MRSLTILTYVAVALSETHALNLHSPFNALFRRAIITTDSSGTTNQQQGQGIRQPADPNAVPAAGAVSNLSPILESATLPFSAPQLTIQTAIDTRPVLSAPASVISNTFGDGIGTGVGGTTFVGGILGDTSSTAVGVSATGVSSAATVTSAASVSGTSSGASIVASRTSAAAVTTVTTSSSSAGAAAPQRTQAAVWRGVVGVGAAAAAVVVMV